MIKENQDIQGHKRWSLLAIVFVLGISLAFSPSGGSDVNRIDSIMIDAGHGGTDPGNLGTGRFKTTEKDVTLKVTKMVGGYIEKNVPDVRVHYTRIGDTYPELHERTKMANRLGVDLFISIHCDAFSKETAQGCGTYVMGPAKTEANLKMAQKENAAILKESNYEKNYNGFDPYSPESYIELSLRQNAFLGQSLSFSDKVQSQFKQRVGRVDRGVKQAPFWVISFTTMPSVLIELGFLTNKEEEDFLQGFNGQELMASAIFRAFKEYKSEIEGLGYSELKGLPTTLDDGSEKNDVDKVNTGNTAIMSSDQIYFAVQLASSSAPIETKPENFKGLDNVTQIQSGGLYKYIYGKEEQYKKAKALLDVVSEHGYKGCFVIALKGNERMDLGEAMRAVGK